MVIWKVKLKKTDYLKSKINKIIINFLFYLKSKIRKKRDKDTKYRCLFIFEYRR